MLGVGGDRAAEPRHVRSIEKTQELLLTTSPSSLQTNGEHHSDSIPIPCGPGHVMQRGPGTVAWLVE